MWQLGKIKIVVSIPLRPDLHCAQRQWLVQHRIKTARGGGGGLVAALKRKKKKSHRKNCIDQLVVALKRKKKRLHCAQLPGSSKECNSGNQRQFELVVSANQRKRKATIKGIALEV